MAMEFSDAPFNADTYLQEYFLELKEQYNIKNVIETGTFEGMTTAWLSAKFDKVWTTEINETYYKTAGERLFACKNVVRMQGDSVKTLPLIIRELDKSNTLFFLDAHWYKNPLLGELQVIAEAGIRPTIICIHDMKNPDDPTMGFDTYPDQKIEYTYEWVKPYIDAIYGEGGYIYFFNKNATGARRGCLFIIAKEQSL